MGCFVLISRKSCAFRERLNVVVDVVVGVQTLSIANSKEQLNLHLALFLGPFDKCKYALRILFGIFQSFFVLLFRNSRFRTHMSLKDASETECLHIIGPYCICQGIFCCCCENKFKVDMIKDTTTFTLLLMHF